jgi:hypothetical protein
MPEEEKINLNDKQIGYITLLFNKLSELLFRDDAT